MYSCFADARRGSDDLPTRVEASAPLPAHSPSPAPSSTRHVAASNGAVGVALLLALFAFTLLDAWRHASTRGLGTYHAGPLFALVGLALATPFDTLHVSATAASVTGLVVALCLAPPRNAPHEPLDVFADDRLRSAAKKG